MRDILEQIGEEVLGMFQKLIDLVLGGKDHSYTASFGKSRGFINGSDEGFSATGHKQMSLEDSCTHLTIVSPSGGGKTTCNILGTLLRQTGKSSLIINDNSKEIRERSANYLESAGYKVQYLDFDVEQFTTETTFYNPLARIRGKADIAKLTSILVKQSSSEKDKFWSISASEVISLAIERVLRDLDQGTHHLASVYRFIQLMISDEDRAGFDLAAHDDLFIRWEVLQSNSSNTRSSIFSSAIAAISWIDTNPNLSLLTSKDTISFVDMRETPTVLFISVPLAFEDVYMPLVNCFYAQFFSGVLDSPLPDKDALPILCLLDEFGSSMHVPNYPKYASNLRKFKVALMAILQTENQLEKYGKAGAKEILNSCSTVYFTGLEDESEKVSRLLGKYTVKEKDGKRYERMLMSADEVRTMPGNRCIIVPNGGRKAIYEKLVPYYKQRKLVERSEMEREEESEVLVITPTLKLFTIDELPEHLRDEA